MKKHYFIFLSLFLSVFQIHSVQAQPLDRVVAIVNNSVITESEVRNQMAQVRRQLQSTNTAAPSDSVLKKQVLQHLIDKSLQLQIAKEMGFSVDDLQTDKAIDDIAKRNHLTTAQMKSMIEQQGTSYSKYRKNIQDEILLAKLHHQVIPDNIKITPEQVDAFMKKHKPSESGNLQYHVKNILIALPEAPTSEQVIEAQNTAEQITRKLQHGGDFSQEAVASSAGQWALEGGDLGFRPLAGFPEVFAKQIIKMKPGQVVGPIHAPNGFHIIKLVGTRGDAVQTSPAETRKQIEQFLYQQKFETAVQSWLQKQHGRAYIKIINA
ncbi:MAG: peptidylprolyl isomerase [Proteobacteria bacterium]|nr:peptidylprolyl isomerase [Pseudomonadota bacterium]